MKIVACYSNKGGVGKTAASVNLAYAFAEAGNRVLLCDLDPQGASSFYFRVKPSQKLDNEAFFEEPNKSQRPFAEAILKTWTSSCQHDLSRFRRLSLKDEEQPVAPEEGAEGCWRRLRHHRPGLPAEHIEHSPRASFRRRI